jgi:beta-glucosidase
VTAIDVDKVLAELTLDEKAALVAGRDHWHTVAIERLDVGTIKVTDGPNGARGDVLFGAGTPTLCVPCGSALGATWDPQLVERIGVALGQQARTKGAHVLLAPTVNLHRHPLAGRTFECYSEDPFLTAEAAVAFVRGVQSQGVATTTKHFAGNESEYKRMTINSVVPERALRELYLVPFEQVVARADAWGIMAAYNRLNGPYCTDSRWLLTELLKEEWGFDGFVVSDWLATHSTVDAARSGLDLEMPGPPAWFGPRLADAVRAGDVDEATVDDMIRRLLLLAERTDAFGLPPGEERAEDLPEYRELARDAAAAAMVLLKNDGQVLPLDVDSLTTLAVVGPNASRAVVMGGGSATVNPHRRISPLDALRERLGDRVDIRHEIGGYAHKTLPALTAPFVTTPDGEPGMRVDYFDTNDLSGDVLRADVVPESRLRWIGEAPDGVDVQRFSVRATALLHAPHDGPFEIGLVVLGRARVLLDGDELLDGWTRRLPRGEALMGFASEEITATTDLHAGTPVELVVEFTNDRTPGFGACYVGGRPAQPDDALERAVAVAADADAAVVFVGTDEEWETEGLDRTSYALPARQSELVERVASVNPRTVVVLNAGAPVDTSWAESVPAVLVSWFGGQEMADAIVDVLTGDTDPGGRLPTTYPRRLEDVPCFFDYPGDGAEVRYGEGVFVGYRGYDARDIEPAWPFGHGLSYTEFEHGDIELSASEVEIAEDLRVTARVAVTSTGARAGREVVQLYVAPRSPRMPRPPQELKAFAKVTLEPGERRDVALTLDFRSFAAWDPERHGWVVDPGDYEIRAGRSSRDIRARTVVTLLPAGS